MAKKKRKKSRKPPMKRGTCRTFKKKDGTKGKICKLKNGKVKFRKL